MACTHRRMHPRPTDGPPNTTPLEAEVVKSGASKNSTETVLVVSALDAATEKRGGPGLLVDSYPQETRDAILRAAARRVSHREIARILRASGFEVSEGAVKNWLHRNG